MAGTDTALTKPQTEQDEKISPGSPLAVQGIILEVLRDRFSTDNALPWTWHEDPTQTDIIIEVSFSEELEARNTTPGVYVTLVSSQVQKIAIGNYAGSQLQAGMEGYAAMMGIQMSVDCTSPNFGESQIIGDIVQHTLLASRNVIQSVFGFHELGLPVLSGGQPFQQDKALTNTSVQFTAEFMVRWQNTPIRPVLQRMGIDFNEGAAKVVFQDHFSQSAISSIQKQRELSRERKARYTRA